MLKNSRGIRNFVSMGRRSSAAPNSSNIKGRSGKARNLSSASQNGRYWAAGSLKLPHLGATAVHADVKHVSFQAPQGFDVLYENGVVYFYAQLSFGSSFFAVCCTPNHLHAARHFLAC